MICIGCAANRGCRSCARCKTFPDGRLLFDHCNKFGFEGVVSPSAGLGLLGRAEPQLGQVEVPRLEAHQLGAVSPVRGSAAQARADRSPEDARQEAPGARQGNRAPAIAAAKPRHRPRAEKAAIHLEGEIAELEK